MQMMGLKHNFWCGHQGWAYADGGRFWQWFLFIGLMIWPVRVGRALRPALKRGGAGGESRSISSLFTASLWIRPRREAPEVASADGPARLDGGDR